MISAKAKQRLAKHVKYEIFAHTKQSLEKLVKHVPFPAQKKENDMFFIENHRKILWFPRRRAEARKARKIRAFHESRAEAPKARKRRAFRTPKDTFWRAIASVFTEKPMFLLFLHHKKPVFNAVLEAKNVPQVIFGTPKARILRAFRTFPCLPRRIAKSTVFYGEITAFVDRKTRFFLFSPAKLD